MVNSLFFPFPPLSGMHAHLHDMLNICPYPMVWGRAMGGGADSSDAGASETLKEASGRLQLHLER